MDNIIIDNSLQLKLIDFGFSTTSTDKLKMYCGTPSYMCPEIVSKEPYYGKRADVWALGVLLFTLLEGTYPFRASNDNDLYRKIKSGIYEVPEALPR